MECLNRMRQSPANANLVVDLPLQTGAKTQLLDKRWERMAERGIRNRYATDFFGLY
jgi:hypothetical protein